MRARPSSPGQGRSRRRSSVSLVRNTSITIGGRWIAIAAAALTGMVIANTMGARGAGIFAMVRVFPAVVAGLLGAGITNANPYFIGARKHPVQAVTETTVALGLILGGIGWWGWLLPRGVPPPPLSPPPAPGAPPPVGVPVPLDKPPGLLHP